MSSVGTGRSPARPFQVDKWAHESGQGQVQGPVHGLEQSPLPVKSGGCMYGKKL